MIAGLPKQDDRADGRQSAPGPIRTFGRDDFDREIWSILGVPVDLATAPEAVLAIETSVRDRRPLSFVTPNVNFLVRAHADPEARRQIIDTDLSLVDGAPLVALGRMLGAPIAERCAGADVFEALRRRPGFPGRRIRVFFFGGREGAAAQAACLIEAEARGMETAGFLDPGTGDLESMSTDGIIATINASNADFIVVALGAAKGQSWIDRNRSRLEAPVISHLGAVVDFTAGTIVRAPRLICRLGLEWAWRIKEEPSLWRRYWRDSVGLLRILATGLAPALSAAHVSSTKMAATAALTPMREGVKLALAGDLIAKDLSAVRRAFRAALANGGDVILDLGGAGKLDAAFLGLVLMLEKNLRARGAVIRTVSLKAAHRRLFRAHAINYESAMLSETVDGASDVGIAAAV